MDIKEIKKDQATVIMVEGRLDSSTSGMLEKKLLSLMETGEKNFLLDFSGMDYISSAGLRVLLMAAKKSKTTGGKVLLSALTDNVKEVFDIAGFTDIFTIFANAEEALKDF
ncbi:STAS domain-containing protein [Syntrophomonas wolfei]|uniref:Anti-sigma factor antagonist n=1 Tax=Syntrophomonas wolfei subsp. wolfei (strain DSM 2245B / Goettingen) TaxID=335541 RepID=Q0AW11_SYNWW|nr:STAS domain-containing protein [Syntrophomonas wolfei]ABI69093.1 anti-anti-sigma regulatory factor, SpoIIAA [Syntrophomonas wolfei subsp. wolfei str. Goettingen G311]